MLSIAFLYGSAVLFGMHAGTILAVGRYGGEREIEQITDRGNRHRTRLAVLALADGLQTPRWSRSTAGAWWFAVLTPITGGHRHPPDRHRRGQLVPVGGVKHGIAADYVTPYPPSIDPALATETMQ